MVRRLLATSLVTVLTVTACTATPMTVPRAAGPVTAQSATNPAEPGTAQAAPSPAEPSAARTAPDPTGPSMARTATSTTEPSAPTAPATTRRAAGGLVIVSEKREGRLVTLEVDSAAVGGRAEIQILLPTGWRPGTAWPVLYLLDGCCRYAGTAWVTDGRADEVTRDARAIVVMPEAGYAGFYSDWLDGPQWETFHLTEVRELVERRYGGDDRRAIAGLSMGGFGALSYAARHPGMFRAAASFSGLVDVGRQDLDHLTARSGDDPDKLWGDDLAAHNPTALAEKLKDIPVYVSCGNGEPGPLDGRNTPKDGGEEFIEKENRAFVKAARKAGVEVTANLYGPGTHRWPYWTRELERALPMLLGGLN
ncbi:alpha/beta hydrolase-fold protein [Nonomuraea mangrovi]|uniref:Alpha/beta hydrolase-fold protein n=1 Tax=Nonomuraea mangrovi TaxID=2316207 RepID=A0ABW4SSC0_9ACTN